MGGIMAYLRILLRVYMWYMCVTFKIIEIRNKSKMSCESGENSVANFIQKSF